MAKSQPKSSKQSKADKRIASVLKEYAAYRKAEGAKKGKKSAAAASVEERASPPRYIKQTSHAVEFFEFNTLLNTKVLPPYSDFDRGLANKRGQIRRSVASRFREIVEKSQVSPVKSPSYESVPQGSGVVKNVADIALDNIELLARIKANIPDRLFKLLHAVFVEDKYLWRARPDIIEDLKLALDFLAWQLSIHSERDAKRIGAIDPNPLFAQIERDNSAASKSPKSFAAESSNRINAFRQKSGAKPVRAVSAAGVAA